MIMPRCNKLLLSLIIWRLASVFIVQTSHVPDEYWQSIEVAHKISFGYGYLTWEWQVGIRSYLYPFLISILYSLLKLLKIDHPLVIIYGPRVFQSLLSAYADYRFYKWTGSKLALFTLCINWYWYYCATRTLINSFETCLTIIALSIYPWTSHHENNVKFLWIVGFLSFVRPTSAVFWLPLCLYHIIKDKSAIIWYLAIGLFYLSVSTAIDVMCYGKLILSPLEFFKINVLNGVSEQYGQMHQLWYLVSGLPVLLGLNYFLLACAIFKIIKNYTDYGKSSLLLCTTIWSLSVYSLLAHKEFRFILPLLPMMIFIINETLFQQRIGEIKKKLFIFLLIFTNLVPGLYFSTLHQKGSLEIMTHLRHELHARETSNNLDVLFLTTCHATPYYSHLHKNISMRFLTCEPNLEGKKDYIDETDEFYANPRKWLEIHYLNNSKAHLPSYIVIDDSISEEVEPLLKYYKRLIYCKDVHFAQHGRFSGYLIYKYDATMNKQIDDNNTESNDTSRFR